MLNVAPEWMEAGFCEMNMALIVFFILVIQKELEKVSKENSREWERSLAKSKRKCNTLE